MCCSGNPSSGRKFLCRAMTLDPGRTQRDSDSHSLNIGVMALAWAPYLSHPRSWERRVIVSILQRKSLRLREATRLTRITQLVTSEARIPTGV